MNLFLNAVSSNWVIIVFDNNRQIIDSENISILWQESIKLIDIIDSFLLKNNVKFTDINNIVVVNWPGSFTWIRTIVLVLNTLAFLNKNMLLTPISYFDLYKNYPIIKASSKRDLFVKNDKNSIIEVVNNEDFLSEFSEIKIIEEWEYIWDWVFNSVIDYYSILKNIELTNKKQIEAFYVKKPNIC